MSDMDNSVEQIIHAARVRFIIESTVEDYVEELVNIHDKVFYAVWAEALILHKNMCMQHSKECEGRFQSYVLHEFNDYYYKYMTSKEL